MWTVDSHDWAKELNGTKITKQYLVNRVLEKASDRGIILMHIGGYETVNALPEIITGLTKQGYTLVRVNDMLPPPTTGSLIHTVVKGDTLYNLAARYNTTIEAIIEANNLK